MQTRSSLLLCSSIAVLLGACGGSDPAPAAKPGAAPVVDAERPATRPPAEPPASQAAVADACSQLDAARVATILGIASGVDASPGHVNAVDAHSSACGYKEGDIVRVRYTISDDPGGQQFGLLEQAAASGSASRGQPVAGHASVVDADGILAWHAAGQLHRIYVSGPNGLPGRNNSERQAIAEAAATGG